MELKEGTPAEIAARIERVVPVEGRQQWQKGSPAEWGLESLAILRVQLHQLRAPGEINGSYIDPHVL